MAAYTTIDNPELYFQCKIYAGDGNSTQAITLDGSEDMQPNLVWVKNRTDEVWHVWSDSIAGAGAANDLATNSDEAAGGGNKASYGFLSAFGSDGFTVSEGSSNASMSNQSSKNYVAWCWKESATAGFDIVSYTGNGSARTISHNLSAVPDWMVVKNRDSDSRDWQVYAGDETDALALNNTDATGDSDVYWNDTAPTSSVFSVKSGATNNSSDATTGYIFTSIQGYSKMDYYDGNGNVNGPFIYLGFRPAWFMIKRTNASEQWEVVDNKRSVDNPVNDVLVPNDDVAEVAAVTGNRIYCDFLANGVKLRGNASSANESGGRFFFIAFAEQPFVNSNGVPANAR